jgi:sigma-E factor negative regulatory protein RseC
MKNPQGRVVSVGGDDPLTNIIVEVAANVACPRCAEGKGCGAGLLGGVGKDRQIETTLKHGLEVRSGDTVSVAMEPRNMLLAAIIVYGYPLLSALIGALLAWSLNLGDLASALFALSGIAMGFLIARRRLQSAQCLREFTPMIVENLTAAE